jgi:hypothetical protein
MAVWASLQHFFHLSSDESCDCQKLRRGKKITKSDLLFHLKTKQTALDLKCLFSFHLSPSNILSRTQPDTQGNAVGKASSLHEFSNFLVSAALAPFLPEYCNFLSVSLVLENSV